MKIAMYVPTWPAGSTSNGIVTYASYVIPALRKLGHELFVITPSAKDESDPYLIDLKKYSEPPPLWNRALFKLSPTDAFYSMRTRTLVAAVKDLINKHGVELLEIEESFGFGHAISRLNLIPVCVRLHGPWFLTKRYEDRRRERLEKRGIESAQVVTSPSQSILDLVSRRYRLPEQCNSFPNPISRPNACWNLETAQGILFVGRFDLLKGADLAIEAFGKLAEKNKKLTMTFVGPDSGINGSKLLDYARAALSTDALSRMSYVGELNQNDVARLRLRHLVTICASRYETLPYAVMEAMAFGCPVVSSDVGGISEMIDHERNGLLFKSMDIDALTSSLQRLIDSPEFAQKLGNGARQTVHLFRPEQIAVYTQETYRQAIDQYKFRGQMHWPDQQEYA